MRRAGNEFVDPFSRTLILTMKALYNPEPEPDDWRHDARSVTTPTRESFSSLKIFEDRSVWLDLAYLKNSLVWWNRELVRMADRVDEITSRHETILAGTRNLRDNGLKARAQSVPLDRVKTGSTVSRGSEVEDSSMLSVSMPPRFNIRRGGNVIIWAFLAQGVTATVPTPAVQATGGLTAGIPSQPSKPPAPLRRNALVDTAIFGSGSLMCVALVVGARYWRGSWGLPAPAMGASSIAFLLWKNDENISAEVTWITFAVWATATLVNVWTAKHRLLKKRFTAYIISSSILTGALIYVFATALQERIITAVPLCAAFSCYTAEVALQKRNLGMSGCDEDSAKEKATSGGGDEC